MHHTRSFKFFQSIGIDFVSSDVKYVALSKLLSAQTNIQSKTSKIYSIVPNDFLWMMDDYPSDTWMEKIF